MLELNWKQVYCGPAPEPAELWLRWNFDPLVLVALALLLFCTRSRSGTIAVGALAIAFVSPLCALSSSLFSARVVHHLLLVTVAAPFLAQALPGRRSIQPAAALAVSTVVLWGWHLPAAYDFALGHVGAYWAMQISLLATATWFWREVFLLDRSPVEALWLIVAGFAQMGMLGAILTFAPEPLYATHFLPPVSWGLTPLTDQQLGGLIMWVPAGIPFAVAGAFVARRAWTELKYSQVP